MVSIVNGEGICISYDPKNTREYGRSGENHVPVQGHEEAQKFLDALDCLGTDATVCMEEFIQAIYDLGVEKGKTLNK